MALKDVKVKIGADTSGFQNGLKAISNGLHSTQQFAKKTSKSLASQAATLAAEYKKQGLNASEAFTKAWSEIERSSASTQKSVGKLTKLFPKSQKSFHSMLSGIKSLVSSALALAGVTAGVASLVQVFKSFTALESSVKRTTDLFKDSAKYIDYFATTTAKSLGMAESAAYSYASTYGNLFKNITADTAENAKVTIAMLKASAVISSKTGRTMDDVMERIRSGLLGNTEAIEDLGIHVNVAMLEATDAFRKIADGRSWEQLSFYEQQQIRTLAILEQADKNFGNEVQQGSVYSLSVLTGSFKDLISISGSFINKALKPVISWLTTITQTATVALKSLASLMGLNLTSDTGSLTDGFSSSAESSTAISDNMSDTVDSAKALKKQLAGFDELNVLSKATDTGSGEDTASSVKGSGTSVFDSLPALEYQELDIDTSAMEAKLEKIKAKLSPVTEALSSLWESVKPFAQNIGEGLKWFWDNVLVPFGNWSVNKAIPVFLGAAGDAVEGLNAVWETASPVLKDKLWEGFLKPIGKFTANTALKAIQGIGKWLKKLGESVTEKDVENLLLLAGGIGAIFLACKGYGILTTATTAVSGFITYLSGLGTMLAGAVTMSLSTVLTAVVSFIAGWTIGSIIYNTWSEEINSALWPIFDFFVQCWNNIVHFFTEAIPKFFTETVPQFFADLWSCIMETMYGFYDDVLTVLTKITDGFKSAWEWITEAFSEVKQFFSDKWTEVQTAFALADVWFKEKFELAWSNIKTAFSGVRTFFQNRWNDITTLFAPVGNWFKQKFENAWNNIREVFSLANVTMFFGKTWGGITSIFSNTGSWFKERFQNAWDKIKGVFADVSTFFGGIKESIVGIWDDIVGGIKNTINWLIDKINFFIGAINGIEFNLPSFMGGGKFDVNIPSIPRLATGGIIEKPTVAMVGEAGKEAVVPLENNTGWLDKIADRISASISSGTVGGDTHVHVELDGREVGRFCIRAVELNRIRQGG